MILSSPRQMSKPQEKSALLTPTSDELYILQETLCKSRFDQKMAERFALMSKKHQTINLSVQSVQVSDAEFWQDNDENIEKGKLK
jgi:hypothetical protein